MNVPLRVFFRNKMSPVRLQVPPPKRMILRPARAIITIAVAIAAGSTLAAIATRASNSASAATSTGQRNSSWRGRKAGPRCGIGSSASIARYALASCWLSVARKNRPPVSRAILVNISASRSADGFTTWLPKNPGTRIRVAPIPMV